MEALAKKQQEILLKLDVSELNQTQIRLLKNITSLLTNVLSADDETEYFESSAELFKKTAELVKHSQFAENGKAMNYGEQAVEYSIDNLTEILENAGIHNIDN